MEAGASWRFRHIVLPADTAAALNAITGDSYPAVLATTRCIALLELAAGHLLIPLLQPGQLSVGVVVNVTHSAPTLAGAWVEAEARYVGPEGKLFVFDVVARDSGGEVMRGTHKRAIVDEARLMVNARKRSS